MTEWYFEKKFTVEQTKAAIEMSGVSKRNSFKFFQQGTGYLTVEIH
ncbi:MAG: hypothetical protein LUD80_03705 [Clostridiales bacterium]|nr:hypothetical protein [Clostridiales bacterium]